MSKRKPFTPPVGPRRIKLHGVHARESFPEGTCRDCGHTKMKFIDLRSHDACGDYRVECGRCKKVQGFSDDGETWEG